MSGKTFLDTNIVVYLYSGDEPEKQTVALALIKQSTPVISTQVLSELANALTLSVTSLMARLNKSVGSNKSIRMLR